MILLAGIALPFLSTAQDVPDESQIGAWYMYFFNKSFENSRFGIRGDYQFRFWDAVSDQEQIMLRTGATYKPEKANVLFTMGYANITTGTFGESRNTVAENRVYQEALVPQVVGKRFLLAHRFRYEQRWIEGQDFRTRYRYNIFVNVPLNGTTLTERVFYMAFYNEIFINGERNAGDSRTVEMFDRNRTYLGVGYGLTAGMRMQLGWMRQATDGWVKHQAQVSIHHNF